MHADDDVARENLCRYVLRHPISLQRLSITRDARVAQVFDFKLSEKRKFTAGSDSIFDAVQLAVYPRFPLGG